ncbi:hypothetical protein AVEN_164737-1 [Araneus ventricosus]|uniref:Uncharacterized protein n=1 Tax=Araneus ventricosus TaxID=182803 RepID=A0A4Y2HJQ7_ARAVE|nr:hypothetical protein AVEN_164737-1 [Araneus ventricosus]
MTFLDVLVQGQKVSVLERQFLIDQRSPRIGRIGSVDKPVTKGMIKRAERSCQDVEFINRYSCCHGIRHGDTRRRFVCQDALNKILSARQDEVENFHHSIRYNIILQLNFEAYDYADMMIKHR